MFWMIVARAELESVVERAEAMDERINVSTCKGASLLTGLAVALEA